MYQNYPFYGYGPPMIVPGQPNQQPLTREEFERGMRFIEKMRAREARDKERTERNKRKVKQDEADRASAAWKRTFSSLELYILGILSYPFWAPIYKMFMAHVVQ